MNIVWLFIYFINVSLVVLRIFCFIVNYVSSSHFLSVAGLNIAS